MKFGGTSLANGERIKNIVEIIKTRIEKKPVIVVSAIAGVTDLLLNTAKESAEGKNPNRKVEEIINIHKNIIKELDLKEEFLLNDFVKMYDIFNGIYLLKENSPRTLDIVASFGEILSSKIVAEYLNSIKIPAKQYAGWEAGLLTNNNFTNAEILPETYDKIKSYLKNFDKIPIIAGFIAKNKNGEITTLGRGGSDYTASIIGAGLNVNEIEIWTDVDGIKTADPRIVENAKQWDKITFEEVSEMAYFGAKVLHPKTIHPAMNKQIPVRVLNTYNINNKGTLITKESHEYCPVRAISLKNNIVIIKISSIKMLYAYGFLAKIFEIFNRYRVSVDLVTTSEISVSVTLDEPNGNSKNVDSVILELKEIAKTEILDKMSIICITGKDIQHNPEILERIFSLLKKNNINIELISQGASSISISIVVKQEDSNKAIKELHKEFFENE